MRVYNGEWPLSGRASFWWACGEYRGHKVSRHNGRRAKSVIISSKSRTQTIELAKWKSRVPSAQTKPNFTHLIELDVIKKLTHVVLNDWIWIPSDIDSNKCDFVTPEITGIRILWHTYCEIRESVYLKRPGFNTPNSRFTTLFIWALKSPLFGTQNAFASIPLSILSHPYVVYHRHRLSHCRECKTSYGEPHLFSSKTFFRS